METKVATFHRTGYTKEEKAAERENPGDLQRTPLKDSVEDLAQLPKAMWKNQKGGGGQYVVFTEGQQTYSFLPATLKMHNLWGTG